MQWNPWQFSEIQSWTFIIEPFSSIIQARIHHWKQQTQARSQRKIEKKKERKFKGFEPVKKKKKKLPIYFRIQAKESTNRIKTQEFLKIPVRIFD